MVGEVPALDPVICKLANLAAIESVVEDDPAAASFMVGTTKMYVPLRDTIDVEAEIARLTKEIDYYEGFRKKLNAKLSNERFVNNAPAAVVEGERKKLADATAKIESFTAALNALK